jgi:hypothetical protein
VQRPMEVVSGPQLKGARADQRLLSGLSLFLHLVKNWQTNCWAHCQKTDNPLEMPSNFSCCSQWNWQSHLLHWLPSEKRELSISLTQSSCLLHQIRPGLQGGMLLFLAWARKIDDLFVWLPKWVSRCLFISYLLSLPNTLLPLASSQDTVNLKKQENKIE